MTRGGGETGQRVTERKAAGALLLSRIRLLARTREEGRWTLARIGGFAVKAAGQRFARADAYQLDVWLDRHGHEQEVRVEDDLTAMGLVSRLEYMLDRFEAELAEHRRRLAEAEARLPGYQRRLGEGFDLQGELDAKRAELEALEADLAANDRTATAGDDSPEEVTAA